jgi:uncharacterized protein
MPRNSQLILKSESGDSIRCRVSDTFWSRFMGLMGKPGLPAGEGLLINPCNSIHMFFMKFAIDAIFLDSSFKIIKLIRNLKPGMIVGTVPGARQVVEVTAGSAPGSFEENCRLTVSNL